MIILLSLGVTSVILLLGALLIKNRQAKKITLKERFVQNKNVVPDEENMENGFIYRLEQDLLHGRTGITVPVYFLMMAVAGVLLFGMIHFLVESVPAALLASMGAVFIPREVVRVLADAKKREFDMIFCKALKRMASALRTGSTLPQAVLEIAESKSLPTVIREEFQKVFLDYEYNRMMPEAFLSMYERTGVEDVKGVSMAIDIAAQKGTKIYETFESYAVAIQERKELEAEANAMLADKKSTVYILAVMPFAFTAMMKLMSPDYFEPLLTYGDGMGIYLVLGVFFYVIVGFFVCRKVTDIKL